LWQIWEISNVCKSTTRAGTLVSKSLSKGGAAWLIGSDVVFSCDAILIVRSTDLPRRPLTNELIHHPRNIAWQIAEAVEVRSFFPARVESNLFFLGYRATCAWSISRWPA
jgi:hypothetical protein